MVCSRSVETLKPEEHERLARLEGEYWWHVGRRDIVRATLDVALPTTDAVRTVIDVGCGTGGNLDLLAEYGLVTAMDDSTAALSLVRRAGHLRTMCGSAIELPIRSASLDVIALLDVLEHIDDDAAALRECGRALKPGGLLLLTVPAYQWLWSGHDRALGHRRRYDSAGIAAVVSHAGFVVRQLSYAVCILFPMIAGYRVLERLLSKQQETSYVTVPRRLNRAFIALLRMEARLVRAGVRLPFGTSLIVAALKRE